MKVDILCLGAHPDDVELFAGGTVCMLTKQGQKVGIVDFTKGERGTRGTPEIRAQEASDASQIMGVSVRENLGIPDGRIENTFENQLLLIRAIRTYRPGIILTHAEGDRHPDHGDAARLSRSAVFYSGLRKVETKDENGQPQDPFRPKHVLEYVQNRPVLPTLVVDVTEVWPQRLDAVRAFKSQFNVIPATGTSDEPGTYISDPAFYLGIEAKARVFGQQIGITFGEGFLYPQGPVPVRDLTAVFG